MTRTDTHKPSAIIPTEYDFVAFEHLQINGPGDCAVVIANRERIKAHMMKTGGTYSSHYHGGNCMVCGAHAIYTVLFYHQRTNTYIRTGQDCAEKLEMSYGDFNVFRKAIQAHAAAVAGKKKALQLLKDKGCDRAWFFFENRDLDWQRPEQIVADIMSRLVKYGSISDKTWDLVKKLLVDIEERPQKEAARKAKEDAERAAAADCPVGRVSVKGVILTIKLQDSNFGTVIRMLVKDERGFKVWGTLPTAISDANKGDLVAFSATVTPSQDDPKFGFFSRPTKATKTTGPVEVK